MRPVSTFFDIQLSNSRVSLYSEKVKWKTYKKKKQKYA